MYERTNKLNNKISINISNINNRFPFFKYTKNYNTNKAHDFLFNKKIQFPTNNRNNKLLFYTSNYKNNKEKTSITLNNNNKSDHLFLKFRNNIKYKSNKNIFHTKTTSGFKKSIKNNDKINKKIKELKREISKDKSHFDFKIFDYKNKNNIRNASKLLDFKNKRNKTFDYKKGIFNINDNILKNFSIIKKSKILYMKNTDKNYFPNDFKIANDKFRNNNFIITQNNTNNYFFLNYNDEKRKNKFSFNNCDISKQSEENSIDFNNIDNSSILNN